MDFVDNARFAQHKIQSFSFGKARSVASTTRKIILSEHINYYSQSKHVEKSFEKSETSLRTNWMLLFKQYNALKSKPLNHKILAQKFKIISQYSNFTDLRLE